MPSLPETKPARPHALLSVVIPARDEEGCTASTIERLHLGVNVLQPVACSLGVAGEHLHGVQGVFVEVFTEEGDFCDEVVGHRDDVASHGVGLDEVEKLARAGPE